ncbi:MAG: sulfite exporter TauE/SafE family protein [Gammaproteobacteria bacterium]|jgi:uncharacterized protein|nr:sulfite exporter TauE/SafE family protein [Gammaproteobacteria bacterium]MBT4491631.1 sulfite exporter TauE/SafE family protein [Gammaproteobacteria bacterium]MBT7369175.1 sulfite exporter TauE/SafE family protein [Gammaproteobacteria bacterium]
MPEFEINTILFLAVVVLGTVVQTVTGFAIGLVTMAGVAVFGVADIAFAAMVISFISMANALAALRKGYRHVEWPYVCWVLAGVVPAMIVGLVLLTYLSEHYYVVLKLILGTVIVLAGSMLMIAPSPFEQRSRPTSAVACGVAGGLIAGLYSAGGAPIAYFMYRQPLAIDTIRFSLLATFAGITAARITMITASGQLTMDVLKVSLIAVPLVIVVTLLSSKYLLDLPDRMVRVIVFLVLMGVGGFLMVDSAMDIMA